MNERGLERTGRSRSRAFTIVDALLALGILGLVAALAMAFGASYVRRSKTVEATTSIGAMARSAAAYFDASNELQPGKRRFPVSSAASVPASVDLVRGKRYASNANDWAVSPWRELKFSMTEPQCYAFQFGAGGQGPQARATATAQGDLDGDGIESAYVLSIAPDATNHSVVASTVQKTMPEE